MARAYKILIVEDEKPIADILEYNLEKEGYEVRAVYRGDEAVEAATEFMPDLILLDIMLPGIDGLSVCRQVRQHMDCPIIMLTAKDAEIDKVLGLELGADDYVTKPLAPENCLPVSRHNCGRAFAVKEKQASQAESSLEIDRDFLPSRERGR